MNIGNCNTSYVKKKNREKNQKKSSNLVRKYYYIRKILISWK